MRVRFLALLIPGLLLIRSGEAQSLQDFEKKVTEFTLPNGLHFPGDRDAMKRRWCPSTPTSTSARWTIPAAKPASRTCSSTWPSRAPHTIGTKNWPEEKKALDAIEEIYDRLDAERNKAFRADPKKIEAIQAELKAAIDKADSYVEENEFDRASSNRTAASD